MCIRHNQRGVSLVELIMFIVIVSVALAGILLVMNVTTKSSADPVIHKQALAIAESLLEEIELQDFSPASGAPATNPVSVSNRATEYHIITNYNGFVMPSPPGIYSINDSASPVPGLTGYSASASAVPTAAAWQGIPAGSAVLITVTVTGPQDTRITIDGSRTAY